MTSDGIAFRVSVAITAACVVLAAGHIILPFVAIDAITVALLVIAVAPWLGRVFRALEFPGIGRFEYQELIRAEAKVAQAGLVAPATQQQTEALPPSPTADPLLALAALRIELEKRLRQIATSNGLDFGRRPPTFGLLVRELGSRGVITEQQSTALAEMGGTLNRAVHAESVDPNAADWALTVGPTILASLDKISTVASSNSPSVQ